MAAHIVCSIFFLLYFFILYHRATKISTVKFMRRKEFMLTALPLGATKKGFHEPCFGYRFSLFAVLMQRVQTYWVVPFISTFTFLRLALYVSGVLRKRSAIRTPAVFRATKKGFCKPCFGCQFSLFAVLMQRVQTYWVVSFPFISTFTFLRLALYVLGVFLLEWLTRLPDILPLPQIAHTLDIFTPPCK